MTDIMILGGTGKTGRRLATVLRQAGQPVRTAARSGADVRFDWDAPDVRAAALEGTGRVYLVLPALRFDVRPLVDAFLDQAVAAGVGHITALSARGADAAPDDTPLRAMELSLGARDDLTWSVLRPSWFMQNYTEGAYAPYVESGALTIPLGDGAEAFIDAEDVAAVAAATLSDPRAHAGVAYDLTGPEALTQTQVASRLSEVLGRPITYQDVDPVEWQASLRAAGVPDGQAALLGSLTETIRTGNGSQPSDAVRRVTGREPRSFRTFLEQAAPAPI